MIINGQRLLTAAPIKDMYKTKMREHGVSHGLGELGYDIRIKQDVIFNPKYNEVILDGKIIKGLFTTASAIEEFNIPLDLGGIVHDKSTWARAGLSVFNTVIEAGWKGFLTLELVYHGQNQLIIPAGAGIAQVIFHQTAHPAEYKGKYQNQADKPIDAIFELAPVKRKKKS